VALALHYAALWSIPRIVAQRRSVIIPKLAVLLIFAMAGLTACAPATQSPSVAAPPSTRVGEMRRLAVVPSGESRLTMPGVSNTAASDDAASNVGRVLGDIAAKWYPKAALYQALAALVQRGIDWIFEDKPPPAGDRYARGITPSAVVADAFARTLVASRQFDQVRTLAGEPVGDDRRETDAVVRVLVPAWGIVPVRDGKPEMMAAYADVRAQVVVRPTSSPTWEHDEDVTHGERLPAQAFTSDPQLARQALIDVLERAGQRLANELLYARGGQ
jgi:hypothetical protein